VSVAGCAHLGISMDQEQISTITWIAIPLQERMMPYYLSDLGSLILIHIIPQEHINYLKESWSTTPLFLFTCKSLAIVFYSEHVEMTELSAKLSHFQNTTYIKEIRCHSPCNINHVDGNENGRGCVNKSSLLSTRK